MADQFEQATRISGLILYLLPPELDTRITTSIKDVARGILSGTIQSRIVKQSYGDEATVREYLKSVEGLLRIASTM